MKKIFAIMVVLVVTVTTLHSQEYGSRVASKLEKKENPPKEFLSVNHNVGGLFTKTVTITVANSHMIFTYVNVKFKITFFDGNNKKITSKVIVYKDPIFPEKTKYFNAPVEVPSTYKTCKVEVLDSDVVMVYEKEKQQAKPVIRGEWE